MYCILKNLTIAVEKTDIAIANKCLQISGFVVSERDKSLFFYFLTAIIKIPTCTFPYFPCLLFIV